MVLLVSYTMPGEIVLSVKIQTQPVARTFSGSKCFSVPEISSVSLTSQASMAQQFLKMRPSQKC